jgi:hypothetical protein
MELIIPLKSWIRKVLENRENDPKASNTKMPFIIATSTSKVIKSGAKYDNVKSAEEKYKKILNETGLPNVYYGCVLSNNVNPKISYDSRRTTVGYDLAGKLIVAEESDRKIPTPIITSWDIDTQGRYNGLKKGTLSVKCFSLKQFEMFEQFFCKFGMYILVEFGDNTFIDAGVSIDKSNYADFITQYKELLDYNTNVNLYFKYLEAIERGRGAYDRFAGLVMSYEYTIDSDGTYNVFLSLLQTNQVTLSVPNIYLNNNVDIATPNNSGLDTFEEWAAQLKTDFKLDDNYVIKKSEFENDFYNWGKVNNNVWDQSSSSEPYISLKLILDILNHNVKNGLVSSDMFNFNLPKYEIDGKEEEIIPIRIHKNLISKNDIILFPNSELVQFDILDNKIGILDKTVDGRINGKDVLEKREVKFAVNRKDKITINPSGDYRLGNALNIFIKYRDVAELWSKTYNKIDFLGAILGILNQFSYGFYHLIYGNLRENQYSTLVDLNLFNKIGEMKGLYRFKANTIKSNVRNIQFTFNASKLQASYTLYNQDIQINNAVNSNNTDKDKSKEIILPPEFFEETRLFLNANADGYYSINQIKFEALRKQGKPINYNPASNKKDDEELKKELFKKINKYSKLFKLSDINYKVLVFTNESLVLDKMAPSINRDNASATNIHVTLTIDGLAGFNCGEYFHIDGLPETYNLLGVFRITNVKHNITDDNGWTTTLDTVWMIKN